MFISIKNTFIPAVAVSLLLLACGKTSVSIDDRTYEPKIVLNAYIYPNRPVSDIQITRNFAIGQEIDKNQIALSEAEVILTDVGSGNHYSLIYDPDQGSFQYPGSDLTIIYGGTYRLQVTANIDGHVLHASSVTTVPDEGLKIDLEKSVYGDLYYRQTDESGQLISPRVNYMQSANAAFFLLS
ncbi:MAG: DUF4249 family protein, partial [Calditrichales bacterium]